MAITSATGTVINSGTVLARSGDAVELASGGSVNNATTATLIDGKDYGSGAVTNVQTIVERNDYAIEVGCSASVTNNLLIQGANGIRTGSAGTLVDGGTISATAGSGVSLCDGSSVTKDGGKSCVGREAPDRAYP